MNDDPPVNIPELLGALILMAAALAAAFLVV